jgi:all-trans-retinol dehydrogenase (NAD+)
MHLWISTVSNIKITLYPSKNIPNPTPSHLVEQTRLRQAQLPDFKMATYREGFTIDTIGKFAGKTILNPYLTFPAAGALASPRILSYLVEKLSLTAPATAKLTKYVRLFAVLSALHNLNNFLTAQSANNWSRDGTWDWDKEIVLLTGGSSGIGENIAKMLIARNPRTKIIIFDFAPLTWTPPLNSNIAYYQIDLTDTAALKILCERIRQEVGHPTVLINNAGLARGETICDGSYADVEITVKTNLIAPILLCKEFVPEMARRNHGHVVNVASASALVSPSELGDYAATKAGVVMLHEVCVFFCILLLLAHSCSLISCNLVF